MLLHIDKIYINAPLSDGTKFKLFILKKRENILYKFQLICINILINIADNKFI